MAHPVDIVVPVYRGEAPTRACLESVLAARNERPSCVVVVDDASPEPALSAWLRALAGEGRITLLAHAENLGFVASVNEGMALHPERDVVLLNSDTEVADGWLDRLAAHAARSEDVGTVTPFSTNATICSYPRTLAANAMPAGETPASLDRAFAAANAGIAVEIPTAVGFCMYVARRCLERAGPFDAALYGTGYGEEVDFCMRAARLGFRHVAATDVFVHHVGEVSFGSEGVARRERAQATVDRLYPEFQRKLAAFIPADPLKPARRRADLERLRRSPRPRVLFATHAFGGGIRRHVEELAAALSDDCESLLLQPNAHSFLTLRWLRAGEELALWLRKDADWDFLVALLRAIGISRLHLHHVHGLPMAVLDLPAALGCPHDVTLHDYFAVCPQYHLVDGTGRYCGEAEVTQCERCAELAPPQWPVSIPQWRAAFAGFLGAAARVIAPSGDCARRVARHFPGVRPEVRPHPQEAPRTVARTVRVLVPGALSPAKGVDLLEACARDARARALPLHFRVLGYVARPLPQWPELPLSLTGEYPEGRLPELIALERGDAIFFPAQCPETFSYTLTAAMASGLPIVATDLGALPERLAQYGRAARVPWDASPERFNEALLAACGEAPGTSGSAVSVAVADMAHYRADYLAALAAHRAEPVGVMPALAPAMLDDPREPMAIPTLVQLFDDGIACGVAASRLELRHRAAAADAQHAHLAAAHAAAAAEAARARDEAEDARRALAETRSRLAAAEARARELEASTSWRLTGPLRALVRLLRRP